MKRQLLIEVDCGEVTCMGCEWRKRYPVAKRYYCDIFDAILKEDNVRCEQCLDAEKQAKELHDLVAAKSTDEDLAFATGLLHEDVAEPTA